MPKYIKKEDWNQSTWDEYYILLEEYYNKYGSIDVHRGCVINGLKLGKWLCTQRKIYNGKFSYKLTEEQISKLNKLGMNWEEKTIWDEYYILLERYYNEYGNINIYRNYAVNGVKLGQWLYTQRGICKNNNSNEIIKEHIEKLNKLGMNWDKYVYNMDGKDKVLKENIDIPTNTPQSDNENAWYEKLSESIKNMDKYNISWDEYYAILEKYYKKNGNIDIHPDCVIKGVKLGQWLNTQRKIYNGKFFCQLPEEQISKLDKLGMRWEERNRWDEFYALAEKYYEKHGNLDIKSTYKINGVALGNWINYNRYTYKNKKPEEFTKQDIKRLRRLNRLKMKWDSFTEDTSNEIYKLLEDYYKENGHINIPKDKQINGLNVGKWLINRRQAYKGNSYKISNKEIVTLNKLNIDWSKRETSYLNKPITDMNKYNITMLKRVKNILRDLTLEGINEIDTNKTQKEIEKIIIKRMWR